MGWSDYRWKVVLARGIIGFLFGWALFVGLGSALVFLSWTDEPPFSQTEFFALLFVCQATGILLLRRVIGQTGFGAMLGRVAVGLVAGFGLFFTLYRVWNILGFYYDVVPPHPSSAYNWELGIRYSDAVREIWTPLATFGLFVVSIAFGAFAMRQASQPSR